ncbi:hypothetical protein GN330_15190 [Nitratireductor sp. CAU 1489]|uniref:Uncharacterized protein n=1 Tax=Nitratireductor arenosus TaxID=2682096 RepID=A0A844QL21_9HYPH|nr:hypothetical protein [Nitratireductor arenosus]MVA98591.1 hypothetical protein [Nitratireductor arenosus]
MFESLAKGLNEAGRGVRAYDACGRAARMRIADEPENAAALLLIFHAAQRFVESYDDQPLSVELATEEYIQFTDIIGTLDRAYSGNSAEEKLDALNIVAARLAAPHKSKADR